MRTYFTSQLEQLNLDLIKMGDMAENSINHAIKALTENDEDMAKTVIADNHNIKNMGREIETRCLNLMLAQQPVASDFRFLSAALKLVTDIERIGNMAADLGEIIVYISKCKYKVSNHIKEMATQTIAMVHSSVDSFIKRDLDLAHKVINDDDIVDDLFLLVKKDLEKEVKKDPKNISIVLDKLMIAKYFERIGDHAVNIGQWVEYAITGQHNGDNI